MTSGIGFFLSAPLLFALDPSRSLFEYNIRTWNRQNGLPFNRISAITQTDDGFLWLGTQNGLARFDGIDFIHVAIPNRQGWYSKNVVGLKSSPRGGLWFCVASGSVGYLEGMEHFLALPGDLPGTQVGVHGLEEEPDGTLWLGSQSGFIGLTRGTTNIVFANTNLSNVQAVYKDPLNRLWVGTVEKGLFYLEGRTLNKFPGQELVDTNIRAITMDAQQQLWVGTSWGLRCYDRDFKRVEPVALSTEVQTLLTDSHGAVWIGTSGEGLLRYVNGEVSSLRSTNGLAEDYVNSLCEDREGNIWAGTRDGLTQLSDLKFPNASTATGPLTRSVHGVCASKKGGLWCTTSSGLYYYEDKSVSYLTNSPDSNPYFKRVLEARNGQLYAISGARQVRIYTNGQLIATYGTNEWPNALAEDARSVLAAVGGKLYRVTPSEFSPFLFEDSPISFPWIRNLSTCADGSLLVATVEGLYRVSEHRIERWTTDKGIADQDVVYAMEDSEGTLWLGSIGGLTRIRHNKVSVIHLAETDPLVNAIVEDNLGNLWLSCSSGVMQANLRNLNDVADGKTAQLKTRLYDGVDALRTIDLTEVEGVGCKTSDGKIWFGGPLGAVEIDPAHIPTDPVPPLVFIQKVLVNGIQESGPSAVSMRHGYGELGFQFTALSLLAPQKIRFRYKLEGYDHGWVEAGSQRSALYANLKPGRYRFQVKACNVDGVWSQQSANFEVELPPQFYQTFWFKLGSGGFFLLGLFAIYAWRTRHLVKKEKALQAANELLETRIRERTRELAEGRNLLRTLIDNLPDPVFVKDPEGRIIIDNLAHARLLGFENPSESVGKSDFDVFSREQAELFRRPELLLMHSGKEFDAEETVPLKTGDIRWMRTTKVPLRDEQGRIVGLAGINRDFTERKKWEAEMESLHKQLLETSRHAGMAEVATSVLHNVGNVLNSVNISASIVEQQVRASSLEGLQRAIQLLKGNQGKLEEFLRADEKGSKLVAYLEALLSVMQKERITVQAELEALMKNIEHIKKIVSMQQSYARVTGISEFVEPGELVEDSLRLHEASFRRHFIQVVREFSEVPKISVDRHKIVQILVNLFANAKYACEVNDTAHRIIRVRIHAIPKNRIRIEVIDNGVGISAENLTRIFSYGFTTRKNGHGFGLHSGALAAKDLGGSLSVQSNGLGKGATFILELPVEHKAAPRSHQRLQARQLEVETA